jgi:hypothetical protein
MMVADVALLNWLRCTNLDKEDTDATLAFNVTDEVLNEAALKPGMEGYTDRPAEERAQEDNLAGLRVEIEGGRQD